jgi:hypothetical protein
MDKDKQLCSPAGEDNYDKYKSCLSPDALKHLVHLWNGKHKTSKIPSGIVDPAKQLSELRKRAREQFKDEKKPVDIAIADHLDATASQVVAKNFRPNKPASWKSKPKEWLTNFDIDVVMAQYNSLTEFKYRFLGVFPVDFAEPLAELGGKCYIPEMCALRLTELIDSGKQFTGFIINLDKHNESGSHWTSIFAVLDPKLPSYGAYYYDSIGRQWPPEIERYLLTWQTQMKAVYPAKDFKLDWSRAAHQHANTECGMFSMMFQILWIERLRFDDKRANKKAKKEELELSKLIKSRKDMSPASKRLLMDKKQVTFDMIVNLPLKDMNVHTMRNVLYKGQGGGGAKVPKARKTT